MKKVDFDSDNVMHNILRTAFPMLVAQILNLLYSIVDRVYIGRIPDIGTHALGAVGLCFPITILITGFTNMFGMGGSPLFSMEMGRGNKAKAVDVINTSFRLLVISSLILTVVCEAFGAPLLVLFGATADTLPTAMSYLRIYLLGTLFLMISTGMNPFITAEGYSLIGMLTVTVGAVANLILDPVFMFVFGMGVEGAAVATVISQGLSFIISMRFLLSARNEYPLRRIAAKQDHPASAMPEAGQDGSGETSHAAAGGLLPYAGTIVALGTAPFIMQVTNSLVSIACNQVLSVMGGAIYVSIMTIISSVRSIAETPMYAVTEGSSPVISYNYGARRPDHVYRAIKYMIMIVLPYTVIMWILIRIMPSFFITIFSDDATMLADAIPALRLYFYAFVFQTLQCTGQTVFKALGKKKQAIFFSLLRKAILVVPLTYILPHVGGLGTNGVFMAEPISNVVGGVVCFSTMVVQVRRELRAMRAQ